MVTAQLTSQLSAVASMCHLVTANHIIGFDGTRRQLSAPGVHLLYGDLSEALQVTVRSGPCDLTSGQFCSCALLARDATGTVTLDGCRAGRRPQLRVFPRGPVGAAALPLQTPSHAAWLVSLASGVVLHVHAFAGARPVSRAVLSVSVTPPVNATAGRGLCGTNAAKSNSTAAATWRPLAAAAGQACWGVRNQRRAAPTSGAPRWRRTTDAPCHGYRRRWELASAGGPSALTDRPPDRRKPASPPPLPSLAGGAEGPPLPTLQHSQDSPAPRGGQRREHGSDLGPTLALASSAQPPAPSAQPLAPAAGPCRAAVGMFPPVSACGSLLPRHLLEALIDICRQDRKTLGTTAPIKSLLSPLEDRCRQAALMRSPSQQATLPAALHWPERGEDPCRCDVGQGNICSDRIQGGPPTVTGEAETRLCDLSRSPCSHLSVAGQNFVPSVKLRCKVVQPESHRTFVVTATYRSQKEIQCRLPAEIFRRLRHTDDVTRWQVRVSYDGDRWSLPVVFITYNGDCRRCHLVANALACSRVQSSCVIEVP
ncbi:uncharacterized protein LOC119099197 [Pollicipes pollicipes]|uniref:uncharacterized protein LOC119099197 n=1 Tax=Pollicipes pollicipes TaxID=41117 RepID=UPI0018855853|nr:uncharacterized protein LOC119099197 [Pollicipes pollicipes]